MSRLKGTSENPEFVISNAVGNLAFQTLGLTGFAVVKRLSLRPKQVSTGKAGGFGGEPLKGANAKQEPPVGGVVPVPSSERHPCECGKRFSPAEWLVIQRFSQSQNGSPRSRG